MRRGILVLALVVAGMTAAESAQALKWRAATALRVVPRPVGADDFRVKSTGIHRAFITSLSVVDLLLPIRMRIDFGELQHNGFAVRGCGTNWQWASQVVSHTCTTRYTQEPCENGVWDAVTRARLEGHPSGGVKFAWAEPPVFIDCACL